MIINGKVEILPASPSLVALAGTISGDTMTDPVDAAQLFDIDMDHVARGRAFITDNFLLGIEGRKAVKPQSTAPPRHGRK
ncbi:hypothetical protein GCM10027396_02520 [Insolitispirillum peregrinum]